MPKIGWQSDLHGKRNLKVGRSWSRSCTIYELAQMLSHQHTFFCMALSFEPIKVLDVISTVNILSNILITGTYRVGMKVKQIEDHPH